MDGAIESRLLMKGTFYIVNFFSSKCFRTIFFLTEYVLIGLVIQLKIKVTDNRRHSIAPTYIVLNRRIVQIVLIQSQIMIKILN